MASTQTTAEQIQETQTESKLKALRAEAKAENDKRGKNKGPRVMVGQTRGKSPQPIKWEEFDDAIPESLPTTFEEFTALTKVTDQKEIVNLLILGFNSDAYTQASDPLKEYVESTWTPEVQNQFRLVTRNYARTLELPLDEAVILIKPGFIKSFGGTMPEKSA